MCDREEPRAACGATVVDVRILCKSGVKLRDEPNVIPGNPKDRRHLFPLVVGQKELLTMWTIILDVPQDRK